MYKIEVGLTFALCVFIAWIIYMANTAQPTLFFSWTRAVPYGDKLAHILLFGLLTLGVNAVSKFKRIHLGKISGLAGTLFVTVFVVVEEFSQHFVVSRTMDAGDLFADAIGITAFTLLSVYLEHKWS